MSLKNLKKYATNPKESFTHKYNKLKGKKKNIIMPETISDDININSELFKIFKSNDERIIHKWIHYFEIYESHFSKYKNKPVNILEIGISQGGSLQMWKKYFGEKAKIFGVDISPACKNFEEENIKIFIGDQSDRTFLKNLVKQLPKIDIVIDDGGHTSIQQIASFEEIYYNIAEDGVYLVEDTHTNYWPSFDKGRKISFINYSKNLLDKLTEWHFHKQNFRRFALPHKKREGSLTVSEFAKTTHSISFYDSVVVFNKKKINEPYHCLSGKINENN